MTLFNWLRPRSMKAPRVAHPVPRARLGVQQLEAREVPAVGLVSALGVGNETGSRAFDVAVDAAGNSYLTGYFTGTTDFDPTTVRADGTDVLTARGSDDMFVAKYAPDGVLAWARRMGGDTVGPGAIQDSGESIAVDGAGNVYAVGRFRGTADFGPTSYSSAGSSDGVVVKLDAAGSVLWANRWGGAIGDRGLGVDTDAAANVYVLGNRFDGTETTSSQSGYEVMKFTPAGATAWANWKWFATKQLASGGDLDVDAAGNVFVAGQFRYTVDFDPGTGKRDVYNVSSGASRAGFVLKLTTSGTFGWVSTFTSLASGTTYGSSAVQSIVVDGGGNVVVGGYYTNTVDFNPGSGTTTLPAVGGAFVVKLASGGGLTWARAIESTSTVFVSDLAIDTTGNVYAAGSIYGTADLDPGAGTLSRTAAGGSDAYALKLTATGDLAWAETFGGDGADYGTGIDVDAAGTVYLAGSYQGTVDFDPDPLATYELTTPGTYGNAFVVKLRQS